MELLQNCITMITCDNDGKPQIISTASTHATHGVEYTNEFTYIRREIIQMHENNQVLRFQEPSKPLITDDYLNLQ